MNSKESKKERNFEMVQNNQAKGDGKKALIAFMLIVVPVFLFAGTGGTEVNGVWDDLKAGITGGWGKLLAVFMIFGGVFLLSDGKKGWGLIVMIIGMSLGMIPAAVESRYTLGF